MGAVPPERGEIEPDEPRSAENGPVEDWVGEERFGEDPFHEVQLPEEEPPTYTRPRFVAAVVLGCAVLAAGIWWLGNTGNVVLDEQGEKLPTFEAGSAEAVDVPEPGRREDCPDPRASVEFEAAELVALFGATATGGGFGDLPASAEVQDQLEARSPSPAVNRVTRIRGWTGGTGSWSTCVLSSWVGPDGPMQSIDIVTASVVPGDERSDAVGDDEDDDDRDTARSRDDLEDRWEITAWIRGVPEDPPPSRAATVEFYNSKRACRRPDRPASVPVPDASPNERLVYALEELVSGTPGRANSAATLVPADTQVLEASVGDGRARVVLTPTLDDLSRCEGTGAYEQVRDTAAAMAAETIPFGDDLDPEVEVVIAGETVDSLRR